ncbi:glycosyltransferase family 2 protein [Galactobacillus timonensis]|jgi:glycosyltransferase involved in cell wall biosynthesis|uniref:glycosyltransferase family 2 protein n=1 Tax=Galactobacillus timonensis TaxID=2041840 RepID=UPI000C85BFD3|nr:glycosyltransferase family 2 protein [Galactobacillus timonensis]
MEHFFLIMPAYNEAENISITVNEWYPVIEKLNKEGVQANLVVINDGSKDTTYSRLLELRKSHPAMIPLTKPNEGHGPTLLFGYHYALDHGADYVFQTDSDGQTNPKEFQQFWDLRHQYDAIFGNRVVRGDGKQRAFVEKTLCHLLKHYFDVAIPDANAPFRLMTASFLKDYLSKMPANYNLPNVMLTTFGTYYHRNIHFIEITFKPRQAGVNSINIKKIIRIGWQALKDFKNFKKEM